MKSARTPQFRACYDALPPEIQQKANEAYRLFSADPSHPGLHFKKIGDGNPSLWSARVDRRYRALGLRSGDHMTWVWIGAHREYDKRT